ncbi:hypothetical protein LA080_012788 [Diaporthe eres]|nr:hypothetical protein LA080_012788 [Diaporthe eres]
MPKHNVYPLRYFDDTPLWRAFILYYMFAFDSVLDPAKLKSGLELLANGDLEYHLPEAAGTNENYQVISYSHVVYATAAAQHPTACYIPKPATGRPSVVVDPDKLENLFRPDGAPTKMDDYLKGDIPQIGLHIVSFLDKTIIAIYFPHTLMDGMSMAPFLDAWIMALQGRASEIPQPFGTGGHAHELSNDPLIEFGTEPTVKHVLASHKMSIAGIAGWMLHNVTSFFAGLENRMVCVPASTMARLHEEAIIDSEVDRNGDEPPPFFSDGDVLCAWWTRLLLATEIVPHSPDKTIVLNSAYSLRKILFDSQVEPSGIEETQPAPSSSNVYVSNLVAFFNVILTAGDILQQPLYRTALAIRTALNTQRTRPQAETFLYMWRKSWGKMPPMFGNWKMDLITFSNWTRAKLFDRDFSAATVEAEVAGRPVRPTYVQNNQFGLKLPNAFPIMGRDTSGNYWLSGYLKRGHWTRIEAQLEIPPKAT